MHAERPLPARHVIDAQLRLVLDVFLHHDRRTRPQAQPGPDATTGNTPVSRPGAPPRSAGAVPSTTTRRPCSKAAARAGSVLTIVPGTAICAAVGAQAGSAAQAGARRRPRRRPRRAEQRPPARTRGAGRRLAGGPAIAGSGLRREVPVPGHGRCQPPAVQADDGRAGSAAGPPRQPVRVQRGRAGTPARRSSVRTAANSASSTRPASRIHGTGAGGVPASDGRGPADGGGRGTARRPPEVEHIAASGQLAQEIAMASVGGVPITQDSGRVRQQVVGRGQQPPRGGRRRRGGRAPAGRLAGAAPGPPRARSRELLGAISPAQRISSSSAMASSVASSPSRVHVPEVAARPVSRSSTSSTPMHSPPPTSGAAMMLRGTYPVESAASRANSGLAATSSMSSGWPYIATQPAMPVPAGNRVPTAVLALSRDGLEDQVAGVRVDEEHRGGRRAVDDAGPPRRWSAAAAEVAAAPDVLGALRDACSVATSSHPSVAGHVLGGQVEDGLELERREHGCLLRISARWPAMCGAAKLLPVLTVSRPPGQATGTRTPRA